MKIIKKPNKSISKSKSPSALEIVYSNRYCKKIEADYAKLTYGEFSIQKWDILRWKCKSYLEGNRKHRNGTIRANVKVVEGIQKCLLDMTNWNSVFQY